jgi:hypothetical protein
MKRTQRRLKNHQSFIFPPFHHCFGTVFLPSDANGRSRMKVLAGSLAGQSYFVFEQREAPAAAGRPPWEM